jgi:hypothetical protein
MVSRGSSLRDEIRVAEFPKQLRSFPLDYNDLRGMGLLAGLIWGLDPSLRRDRLNGIALRLLYTI